MKKIGIYKILNKLNNKFYIGSSCDLLKRFNTHKNALNKNKHHSVLLQRSWNVYGSENFEFIILEECLKEEKIIKEQRYIDELTPKLNCNKSARCPMENRKHSEETILKFKK